MRITATTTERAREVLAVMADYTIGTVVAMAQLARANRSRGSRHEARRHDDAAPRSPEPRVM
jgi:hypothetical protein